MEIEVEHLPGFVVIKVTEGLVREESENLITNVKMILEEGTHQFIVDLVESGNIDSSGIGSLLRAYTEVAKQSGRFVVVLPGGFFKQHLTGVINLKSVFELYRSREEAIEALREPAIVRDRIEPEARRK